jgi:hypothetical protein
MTFYVGATKLLTQPSDHRWADRNILGYSGNANPIYSTPRSYEMSWEWLEADAFQQLIGFYQNASGTTKSVSLPAWNSATGGYASYNAQLSEPTYQNSFMGAYGSVRWLLVNIRT